MQTPVPGSAMNSQPPSVLTGGSASLRTEPPPPRSGLACAAGAIRTTSTSTARRRTVRAPRSDRAYATTSPACHRHPLLATAPPAGPAASPQTSAEPYRVSHQPSLTGGVVGVEHEMHATEEAGFVLRWGIGGCVGVLAVLAAWLPAPAAAAGEGCPKTHGGPAALDWGINASEQLGAGFSSSLRELPQPVDGPGGGDPGQGRLQVRPGAAGRLHRARPGGRATRASSATASSRPRATPCRSRAQRNQGNRGRQRPRHGAALRRHRLDLGRLRIRRARATTKRASNASPARPNRGFVARDRPTEVPGPERRQADRGRRHTRLRAARRRRGDGLGR